MLYTKSNILITVPSRARLQGVDWAVFRKYNQSCVCKVGTFDNFSDCHPRVQLWAIFFRHAVRGHGRYIEGLKRIHTLIDRSRLMPVWWTVTSSTIKGML